MYQQQYIILVESALLHNMNSWLQLFLLLTTSRWHIATDNYVSIGDDNNDNNTTIIIAVVVVACFIVVVVIIVVTAMFCVKKKKKLTRYTARHNEYSEQPRLLYMYVMYFHYVYCM